MKEQTGKVMMYKEFVDEIQIWVLTTDADHCLLKGLVRRKYSANIGKENKRDCGRVGCLFYKDLVG